MITNKRIVVQLMEGLLMPLPEGNSTVRIQWTQLTLSRPADETFTTGRGSMTYHDWLIGERDRVLSDPERHAEIRERNGKISLWVDDVSVDRWEYMPGRGRA